MRNDWVSRRETNPGAEVQERTGSPERATANADADMAVRDRDTAPADGNGIATHREGAGYRTVGPAGKAWRWLLAGAGSLRRLAARNMGFAIALGLAAVLRAIVMAGFQPAALIRLDSYIYLLDTTTGRPDPDNPDGYPFFLWLLKPFHSLALVAGLQHLLGLGIAVLAYVILRRHGVPRWAATLATLPVLFDPREMLVEHSIMADTLATLLMIAAFAAILGRPSPSAVRAAAAGLLVGASSLVRPTALPLIPLVALFLLVTRSGWRRAAAALAAGALPLIGYAAWFQTAYGVFNLTNSSGIFLWSRTMSFANCAVIKPPPGLQQLCPSQNPGRPGFARPDPYSWGTLLRQETPQYFLWNRRSWLWQPQPPGYEPPQVAFTPAKNARAQRFALRAIAAQPLGYATVVAEGVALTFFSTDHDWRFPNRQLLSPRSPTGTYRYEVRALRVYTGTTAGLAPYLGGNVGTRPEQPYAQLIRGYQRVIFLPGGLFALVFAAGLAGLLIRRRRSWAAALLWISALVVLVFPIAEHQFNYRYALAAVPLACMSTALVAAGRRRPPAPAQPAPADASEPR